MAFTLVHQRVAHSRAEAACVPRCDHRAHWADHKSSSCRGSKPLVMMSETRIVASTPVYFATA
eukprot:5804944-Amphidinium_carterae.1